MTAGSGRWKRWLRKALIVLLMIGIPLGYFGWYKFFRTVPQPVVDHRRSGEEFPVRVDRIREPTAACPIGLSWCCRGSSASICPGPGGYASVGLPWKEGEEFPAGFAKKTVGFERVSFNCALCHATQYRVSERDTPTIVAAGGSHTADIQALLGFFSKAADDKRFNADTIMTEIDLATRLSWIDRMIYKYLLIPDHQAAAD